MIKYTICPGQETRYNTIEMFRDITEVMKKIFEIIEEEGVEARLYQVPPGHRTSLFSSLIDEKTMFIIHFICTNVNTGYFAAGYEAPSKGYFYIDLPEFKFE